jgi:hypothetical protein
VARSVPCAEAPTLHPPSLVGSSLAPFEPLVRMRWRPSALAASAYRSAPRTRACGTPGRAGAPWRGSARRGQSLREVARSEQGEWHANNPGKEAGGLTSREGALYIQRGEIDMMMVERQPNGKAKIIRSSRARKSGNQDGGSRHQRCRTRTTRRASLLRDGAAGRRTIRIEVGDRDITGEIDPESDAAASTYSIRPDANTESLEDAEVVSESKYGWQFLEQAVTLIKTGVRDTNADARGQIADQSNLLSDGAAGKKLIRLEVGGRDITAELDLASDASASKSTRGPTGKGFDKSLGVSASDLEVMCKDLLANTDATKGGP